MKILLVEDIRVERKKLKHWLEELRCEVIEASDGGEGLDLYHAHRPELVITDVNQPQKNGVQMIIELQRNHPIVKYFNMSGAWAKKQGEFLPIAKGVGVLCSFAKPIDKRELLDAVLELFPEANPNLSP